MDAVDRINQIAATIVNMVALYKALRNKQIADGTDPNAFLNDEMLIQESREASEHTVATVDAIRKKHGLL